MPKPLPLLDPADLRCEVPENHKPVTVNSTGRHPELLAIPVDGLGPPFIFDRIRRQWLNFHNERVAGKLGIRSYHETTEHQGL